MLILILVACERPVVLIGVTAARVQRHYIMLSLSSSSFGGFCLFENENTSF
jgi:hypothetical protein